AAVTPPAAHRRTPRARGPSRSPATSGSHAGKRSSSRREAGDELVVDAAERAVAHHDDLVAGACVARDRVDERVEVLDDARALAERSEHRARVPAQVSRVAPDAV